MPIRPPHWFKPWPWLWDRRKEPRASIVARQASDDTLERMERAELDAALAEEHAARVQPVLDQLQQLLDQEKGE